MPISPDVEVPDEWYSPRPFRARGRGVVGIVDVFGFFWSGHTWLMSCKVCGQPDDCGDCNHVRLSESDRRQILKG